MRTLSVRYWMLIGLVLFVASAAVMYHLVTVVGGQLSQPSQVGVRRQAQALASAERTAAEGVANWSDPAWQASMRKTLHSLGLGARLVDPSGRTVFAGGPVPPVGPPARQSTVVQGGEEMGSIELFVPRVTDWAARLGAVLAVVLAVIFVRWQMGRSLVRPLEAMADAARRIAAGDLDVNLPKTRVREVQEVQTAFQAMAAGLQESVARQAELEEQRRFFIGAIAHDLRTPLFALRGYLSGFEQGLARSPEKAASYLAVSREKADQLDRLVSQLFAYAKTEYLGQEILHEPLDLARILERAVAGIRPGAEAKGVAIVLNVSEGGCSVEGDADLLERAGGNLLDNALRHAPRGGRIEVTCRAEGERARFTVADDGPGIHEQDLPHLMEPMYRGDPARSSKTGGAGLGLTIAGRVLAAHGGGLVAANRPTGGAEFSGWLPRSAAAHVPRRAS